MATKLPTSSPAEHDQALINWFRSQQISSIDTLESAARQIITLSTTLLSLLLGILALAGEGIPTPVPIQLTSASVLGASIVCTVALFFALSFALGVVIPQRNPITTNDLDNLRVNFEKLLKRKSHRLYIAIGAFAIAIASLTFIIVSTLILLGQA